jgi:hypothetical protein
MTSGLWKEYPMSARSTRLLWLIGLAIICSSCQDGGGPADPAAVADPDAVTVPDPPATVAQKSIAYASGHCDTEMHEVLEGFWNSYDDVVCELAMGVVNDLTGGSVTCTPSGWPPEYEIRLDIPAGAIPDDAPGWPDVMFHIAVPVFGPPGEHDSVPFSFMPDGMHFEAPVSITLCWPPWAGTPSTSGYRILHLFQEWHEGEVHYAFNDRHDVYPEDAPPPGMPVPPDFDMTLYGTGLSWDIDHFSRWELVDGDGGGGDKIPPLPPEQPVEGGDDPLDGLTEGGCWIPAPPPPPPPPGEATAILR